MITASADRMLARRNLQKPSKLLLLTVGAGTLAAMTVLPAYAEARNAPSSFADLAAKVKPAVVSIAVQHKGAQFNGRRYSHNFRNPFPDGSPYHEFFRRHFQGPNQGQPDPRGQRRAQAVGSGFIVDPAGYVVTNNHVVRRAAKIEVIFDGGKRHVARIVGRDPRTDLALLKIKGDQLFPSLAWGNSDSARVGDWIMAVGNAFGLHSTVTAGIISARGRSLHSATLVDFLQIDAPINKGNSGGPTFNMNGEVIGVNTAIYSPTGGSVGLGFAIPSNTARKVITQLKQDGKISRGWLGVQIQPVSAEIAEAVGLEEARGALVAGVMPESPANRAGVRTGDVIVSWAGKKVKNVRGFVRKVAFTKTGQSVNMVVWRQGSRKTLTVNVGESGAEQAALGDQSPDGEPVRPSIASLGLTVAPVDSQVRRQYGLSQDAKGLVILDVEHNSAAAAKGLRRGDLITHVNGDMVTTAVDMKSGIDQARQNKRDTVLLRILRRNQPVFVAVKIA